MALAEDAEIDPLDAYMASLELPSASATTAPASPVLSAIDWSTARRRVHVGVNGRKTRDEADDDGAESAHHADSSSAVVKNRRYRRLLQLLQGEKVVQDLSQPGAMEPNPDDWYFSDAMIQQRNPALFHFHLGQYLPASAAAAIAAEAATPGQAKSSSSSSDGQDTNPELLLSAFLLSTDDRREMELRRALEQRTWGKFTGQDERDARAREKALFQQDVEEEEDSSSDEDEDEEETKQSEQLAGSAFPAAAAAAAAAESDLLSIGERRQLLVDLMTQRFLRGRDHQYVDYAEIDANAALDDLEQMQRDAEDAYFDTDE